MLMSGACNQPRVKGSNAEVGQIIAEDKLRQLFDARHGVKKQCQTRHRVILALIYSMPCLASFFDAMSGVKKLTNLYPAINCTTSVNEPSIFKVDIGHTQPEKHVHMV